MKPKPWLLTISVGVFMLLLGIVICDYMTGKIKITNLSVNTITITQDGQPTTLGFNETLVLKPGVEVEIFEAN